MGIKNLSKLIGDCAPAAVRELNLKELMGRTIAIDASMAIYQFLVAVRSASQGGNPSVQLTNAAGEVTSHLQGMFNRTIRMLESGIKPVYVFDGKPPQMKSGELEKRKAIKEQAMADMKQAEEEGKTEDVDRYSKRTVHMTKAHQEDCKQLLRLMGVPVVEAPCEAEAQCAALAEAGKVFAAASEDMDTLTFRTPYLLRRITFSDARKLPVLQFKYADVLEGLGMTTEQFVDLCILCGCDYCDSIRGIGPKTAVRLMKKHGSLEEVLANLDPAKYTIPENFDYKQARKLFLHHEVTDPATLNFKWGNLDEEKLRAFLIDDKGFNPDRVLRGIEKLKKAKGAATQQRMDSFFRVLPSAGKKKSKKLTGNKRKGKGGGASGRGFKKGRGSKK